MSYSLTETDLEAIIADRNIRLLVLANGKHIWETLPSPLHQMLIDDIRATIRPMSTNHDAPPTCGCHHIADVYVRLPDSSLVRPDIAIFCTPLPRQRHALGMVPAAVIEVVSPGTKRKILMSCRRYTWQTVFRMSWW